MMESPLSTDENQNQAFRYWGQRAGLGELAGTKDVNAKRLEMETLASFIRDGMKILDVGCGNGLTAIEIARRFDVAIVGIDYSPEMIYTATNLAAVQSMKGKAAFMVRRIPGIADLSERFDLAYTERTLINLPDWPTQLEAIREIGDTLFPGGLYLMCENSKSGLDQINALRQRVGLSKIEPPWHNRYLLDEEINAVNLGNLRLQEIVYYSSTYYLLSRVVNAWLAMREKREPDYESPINHLAIQLPSIGTLGQGRLWIWKKSGASG